MSRHLPSSAAVAALGASRLASRAPARPAAATIAVRAVNSRGLEGWDRTRTVVR